MALAFIYPDPAKLRRAGSSKLEDQTLSGRLSLGYGFPILSTVRLPRNATCFCFGLPSMRALRRGWPRDAPARHSERDAGLGPLENDAAANERTWRSVSNAASASHLIHYVFPVSPSFCRPFVVVWTPALESFPIPDGETKTATEVARDERSLKAETDAWSPAAVSSAAGRR